MDNYSSSSDSSLSTHESSSEEDNPPTPYDKKKSLRILHINAQSIRNKMLALEAESHEADIIAITETWLGPNITNEDLALSNYHRPARKDRPHSPYGGVAMYCRENLSMIHRTDLDVHEVEIVWVEIFMGTRTFLIGTIYRPPNALADH